MFNYASDPHTSHGFGIFLLSDETDFPDEFDDGFGYRPDYYGLGVFLHKELDEK